MTVRLPAHELLFVEDTVWVITAPTGLPVYDFRFDQFLQCRHLRNRPGIVDAVSRIGAIKDYGIVCEALLSEGIRLVHSPEEHLRCSQLPFWYPDLCDLTPKSIWFDSPPDVKEVTAHLNWPIFVKGARQTSRHRRSFSIIQSPDDFAEAMAAFQEDPILGWQSVVCREYVPLRQVEDGEPERIPSSFEFRTFWWRGELAGCGCYWWEGKRYVMTEAEKSEALSVAQEAARRIAVRFLVVDIAQRTDGRWIVIECNDGQESGYAGVSAIGVWQNVLSIERRQANSGVTNKQIR